MVDEVAFLAADYLDAYVQAQQWTDIAAHCREPVVWKPPIGGEFKVNFEGGIVQVSKCDRYQSDYSGLSWKTSSSFILEDVMDSWCGLCGR